jgi:hypothetical protein
MADSGGLTIEPGVLVEAAALAADAPPKAFSSFDLTPLRPADGPRMVPWIFFSVRCKSCGLGDFHVGGYPSNVPNDAAGDKPLLPPHRLKCANCAATSAIFDPRTDGYDGILCGGTGHPCGENGETFTSGAFTVHAGATYNIDLAELQDLASQAKVDVGAQDLFDWVNIVGDPVGKGEPFEYSYECA